MYNKRKFLYYVGNVLILLSLSVFAYIFYPIASVYVIPQKVENTVGREGMYLSIPKIKAYSSIKINVNPYDRDEYQKVLKTSIAHAKDSSLPGEDGTVFIFAHSSGPPWEITRQNTIFLRLSELNEGDAIQIQKDKKLYVYKVREKKEVSPTEVSYLSNTTRNQLILQTCTPIGTDWKRLLVFADLQQD